MSTIEVYNKLQNDLTNLGYYELEGNKRIEILDSFLKKYTMEKLDDLNVSSNDDLSVVNMFHKLSDSIKDNNERDVVFLNCIYILVNLLGNVQRSGIFVKSKDAYELDGTPVIEIGENNNVSSIEIDKSCSLVDNTIYVYKTLTKTLHRK